MFCTNCGKEITENAKFCPNCGKAIAAAAQVNEEPTPMTPDQLYIAEREALIEKERSEQGNSILKFAILGLAFGSSFFFSLLGLIFSIVSRVKLGSYMRAYGETKRQATVGKHIGVAGLVVSIIFTVFCAFYFLIIIAAVASAI